MLIMHGSGSSPFIISHLDASHLSPLASSSVSFRFAAHCQNVRSETWLASGQPPTPATLVLRPRPARRDVGDVGRRGWQKKRKQDATCQGWSSLLIKDSALTMFAVVNGIAYNVIQLILCLSSSCQVPVGQKKQLTVSFLVRPGNTNSRLYGCRSYQPQSVGCGETFPRFR